MIEGAAACSHSAMPPEMSQMPRDLPGCSAGRVCGANASAEAGGGGGAQGKWLSPRVINLALQYLTVAVKAARTWKVLQPHVPQLMARVLFPLMCFDDADAELWEDDPQEYIRKVRAFAPRLPFSLAPSPWRTAHFRRLPWGIAGVGQPGRGGAAQGYDIMEEMYSPKSAASNFLHELCEARGRNMAPFMEQARPAPAPTQPIGV